MIQDAPSELFESFHIQFLAARPWTHCILDTTLVVVVLVLLMVPGLLVFFPISTFRLFFHLSSLRYWSGVAGGGSE
jgi:uncharacterized membrane protein YesL